MTIVIKGARLIDGTERDPIEDAVIVIRDKRIGAVGPAAKVTIDDGDVTIIDVGGRSVLPALTDAHASMTAIEAHERPDGITDKAIGFSILRAVANGRRCLNAGITTVRVDGSAHHATFALREVFAAGTIDGPRLVVPGRAITTSGGHAWRSAREADGPDEVRKATREQLKAGADWIKLMVTGGAGTANERPEENLMTLPEIAAAVEEAHRRGKLVFAHVSCAEGARNCIAAGVDSIEHGFFLEEDVAQSMKAKSIFLIPTMAAYRRLVELGKEGVVLPTLTEPAQIVEKRHAQSFQMALRAGVKIATGTDSGADWYPMGASLHDELTIMTELGMPPIDALKAATSRAAELLRMQADLGTIEAGKLADILIVDGDPLADINAIRKTWLVLKEGRPVFQRQPVPQSATVAVATRGAR